MTSKLIRYGFAAIFLALPLAAQAADKPVRSIYKAPIVAPPVPLAYDSWSGFYLGAHLGYLWGRTRVASGGLVTDPGASTNGFVGGFLGGYNWRAGPLVVGLEGDIGWTNAHGTAPAVFPILPNTYDINWTSYLRARAGVTTGSWLLYAAGGLAFANFNFQAGGPPIVASGATLSGWTIGVGAEYALNRQMRARLEYLYADFGQKTLAGAAGIPQVGLTAQTLRGAIVFPLDFSGGGGVVAKY